MDRAPELRPRHIGHRGKDAGEKAFHVAAAAAVELAGARRQRTVAGPALPVDRNHVGMAGQNDPGGTVPIVANRLALVLSSLWMRVEAMPNFAR